MSVNDIASINVRICSDCAVNHRDPVVPQSNNSLLFDLFILHYFRSDTICTKPYASISKSIRISGSIREQRVPCMQDQSPPPETVIDEIQDIWAEMSLRTKVSAFAATSATSALFALWLNYGC